MGNYHIAIIRPEGDKHSDRFFEVADALQSALRSLGNVAVVDENTIDAKASNILLGAHLLTEQQARSLPASTVVYNLEQLDGAVLPAWYMDLPSHVRIWEYSPLNLARWQQVPCLEQPSLVEVGFAAEPRRIPTGASEQPADGDPNPLSNRDVVPGLRKLYLDMVQRCIINTVYETQIRVPGLPMFSTGSCASSAATGRHRRTPHDRQLPNDKSP